jgi:hypothetical protein
VTARARSGFSSPNHKGHGRPPTNGESRPSPSPLTTIMSGSPSLCEEWAKGYEEHVSEVEHFDGADLYLG